MPEYESKKSLNKPDKGMNNSLEDIFNEN